MFSIHGNLKDVKFQQRNTNNQKTDKDSRTQSTISEPNKKLLINLVQNGHDTCNSKLD